MLLSVFRKRTAVYFTTRKLSRKANLETRIKTLFLLSLFSGSYLFLLLGGFSGFVTFLLATVCGLTLILIVYNISHDASHNALFESKSINKLLALTFNLAGGSAYMWHITHDEIHHTYANVIGIDADLDQAMPFLRINDTDPLRWFHRYQSAYVWVIYSVYSLYLVFIKDFEDYRIIPRKGSPLMNKKHSMNQNGLLLLSKVIYLTYSIVLPLYILPFHWTEIIAGYIGVTMIMSIPLVLVQAPLHVNREAAFIIPETNGMIGKSWLTNTLDNTTDYGSQNRLLNFLFGGINAHVVHHLCPGVCHVHYPALSGILKKTLKEFGRSHRDLTMWKAIRSHLLHLNDLSKPTEIKNKRQ